MIAPSKEDNMREIKFRAWDGERKEMVYDFCIMASGTVQRITSHPEYDKRLQALDETAAYMVVDVSDWYAIEVYKVMQFTGLYDKEEKEIYEGDIIKRPVEPTPWNKETFGITKKQMEIALIKWSEDDASFKESFRPKLKMHPCFEIIRLGDVECEVEVIGNVYENPDLVKAQ
jgi:uncharacterized phage protein (TIGR01671 family)